MSAYVAGEARAFEELFSRYAPRLLKVLARDLSRPEEARDLLQQTFLQVHRARRDFDTTQTFRPWVFTIALNLKREHLRWRKRRPEDSRDVTRLDQPTAGGQARAEAARDLEKALRQLSDEQGEVIALHWLGGLSFEEVAHCLGITPSAAKLRAHRGYGKLRSALGAEEKPSRAETAGNPAPPSGILPETAPVEGDDR